MRQRLAEVARHVGVSEATVSRVLNSRPGVSESTRQAVLTALDVLGYERPTQLRGERARLVGLVLPELQNPIFPAVRRRRRRRPRPARASRRCCAPAPRAASPRPATSTCCSSSRCPASSSPAGCTPRPMPPHSHYARLAERSVPVVLVNAAVDWLDVPAGRRATTCVAGEQAVEHLISLGHTQIGLLLGPVRPPARRGASSTAARGWPRPPRARRTRRVGSPTRIFSLEGGQAAGTELLGRGVTAMVCASDPLALGAIRPPAARASACPATSRSSATTTRR